MTVIDIAKVETGYLEKASNSDLDSKTANAGNANFTKYARDIDRMGILNGAKNGYAWCAIFVMWCFYKAYGRADFAYATQYSAGAQEWASSYKTHGAWFSRPQKGDQIFFAFNGSIGHTGLVADVDSTYVYTVEGNTSGGSGVIPNGGGVFQKKYLLGYRGIAGYGRPNYSLVEDEEMTGKEIYEKLNEHLRTLPCPPEMAGELAEAVKMGITDGTRPMELIPRYQAAIMAKRAAKHEIGK